VGERRKRVKCLLHKTLGTWLRERDEMRVLRGSVHDKKARDQELSLGDTTRTDGRESIITSDTEGTR